MKLTETTAFRVLQGFTVGDYSTCDGDIIEVDPVTSLGYVWMTLSSGARVQMSESNFAFIVEPKIVEIR